MVGLGLSYGHGGVTTHLWNGLDARRSPIADTPNDTFNGSRGDNDSGQVVADSCTASSFSGDVHTPSLVMTMGMFSPAPIIKA